MLLEVGQVWRLREYTMTITKLTGGVVTWDGLYDVNYESPRAVFERFLTELPWHKKEEDDAAGN